METNEYGKGEKKEGVNENIRAAAATTSGGENLRGEPTAPSIAPGGDFYKTQKLIIVVMHAVVHKYAGCVHLCAYINKRVSRRVRVRCVRE